MELLGQYAVKFISDDQLPPEQDWMFLECGGDTFFFVKESRISECVLEDAWTAYRQRAVAIAPAERLRAV